LPSISPSASPTNSIPWTHQKNITGVYPDISFGVFVAISEEIFVVGSQEEEANSYAFYIYEFNGSTGEWEEGAKLSVSNNDSFMARSVAIDGQVVVIGSCQGFTDGGGGSIYIFEKDPNEGFWIMQEIIGSNGVINFGTSVGVSHGVVAVLGADSSSNGSIFVYTKDSNDIWQLTDKLTINDGQCYMGGAAIAISGEVIAFAQYKGASAFVFGFNKSTGKWQQTAILTLSDSSDVMYGSVGVSENIIVLGAYNGQGGSGSVYIYELDPSSGVWYEDNKYVPKAKDALLFFGTNVDVDGYSIVVGSPGEAGPAYVFILEKDQASGVWDQKADYDLESVNALFLVLEFQEALQ
jgi:hypothetical protein